MNIATINLYQYSLPLTETISIRGHKMTVRDGLIIQLISSHGHEGFGEIAPLPGLSSETLEEAREQALFLKNSLRKKDISGHVEKLDGKFDAWLNEFGLKPSVRFGFEMAVLNLMANTKKIPLNRLLSDHHHDEIKISGLIQGNKDQVKKQAQELIAQGFTSIKLKIDKNIEEEIDKIKTAESIINGQAMLHLDANQALDFKKAVKLGEEIGCAAVIYIEEPFKDTTKIPEFFMKTLIPVALDESLNHLSLQEIQSLDGVDVLILKPTILGGIERTWKFINHAKKFAIDYVLSSSYESSLGLLCLAQIAGSSLRDYTAGIDTFKWFKQDLLKEKLTISHGKLNIKDKMIQSKDINFELLKEIK